MNLFFQNHPILIKMRNNILLFSLVFINFLYSQTVQESYDLAFENYKSKKYDLALKQFLNLSEDINNNENDSLLTKTYAYIGLILKKTGDLKKAKTYYFKALNLSKSDETSFKLYTNLGSLNYNQNDLDSSLYYYKLALSKNFKFNNILEESAHVHKNLSGIYISKKQIDSAKYHSKLAAGYLEKTNNTKLLISYYNNTGSIYMKLNKIDEAKEYFLEGYKLLNDSITIDVNTKKSLLTNLTKVSYLTNDIDFARKLDTIREIFIEKAYRENFNEKLTTIEAKYNQDIARKEEALKTEALRKKREKEHLWFSIFSLIGISILVIALISYRNSKLKTKNLSLSLIKKDLEKQNEIQLLKQQTQNKVINATLDGRENERKEIAQILHDSVSALLSSANLHIQVAKKKQHLESEELNKTQLIINEASDKVRDLSHKLISAILLKFGLEYAVNDLCEKYSNSELSFELETFEVIPRFNQALEIKLFSIIEEFVNNIIKHSKASKATITLVYENSILNIEILDNGVGFDTRILKTMTSTGIGLSQIIARIENLECKIDISSKKNKGTQISIRVPVC